MERLIDRWPRFARDLHGALVAEGELDLAEQVSELRVVQVCGCGDDFCQSFYTVARPDGAWGPSLRNPEVDLGDGGWIILDVVQGEICYIEVLFRRLPLAAD